MGLIGWITRDWYRDTVRRDYRARARVRQVLRLRRIGTP
jgi:hypothetical protein